MELSINKLIQKKLREEGLDYVDPITANRWTHEANVLLDNPNNPGGPLRKKLRKNEIHGAKKVNNRWEISRIELDSVNNILQEENKLTAPSLEDNYSEPVADVSTNVTDDLGEELLSRDQLTMMRSRILDLLRSIDTDPHKDEKISAQISRLTYQGLIPRASQPWFRTVTEMRNVAEHEVGWVITPTESRAVRSAWDAIKEWAVNNGYRLEDIFEE